MYRHQGYKVQALRSVVVAALALCWLAGCSQSVRFSSNLTQQLQGWTASQIDTFRVYVKGSAKKPSAVVLDNPAGGAQFVGTDWAFVEGEASYAVVAKALDMGLQVARLENDSLGLLGFLLGQDEETPSELRYFQLRVTRDGNQPTYEVLHLVFPNPQQFGDGGGRSR